MWVYVSFWGMDEKIQWLDIDLCDEDGRVCVRIKGIFFRMMEGFVLEILLNGVNFLVLVWDLVEFCGQSFVCEMEEVVFIVGDEESVVF